MRQYVGLLAWLAVTIPAMLIVFLVAKQTKSRMLEPWLGILFVIVVAIYLFEMEN